MASAPARARALPGARALRSPPLLTGLGLAALTALSIVLRTGAFHNGFWIDEGLSVGIAGHPLTEIPGVLRQDGSPPLYYMLLHFWLDAVGDTEARTHLLSLLFATATIPVGYWAGASLFGRRAGFACAALFALNPFLTHYAQETRMYSMLTLLTLLATTLFMHAFVLRDRRFLPWFAVVLALMLWTHNWALFLGAGSAAAVAVLIGLGADRRALLRDAALAYGGALLLFSPWLPTLWFQIRHTGAPWAEAPPFHALGDGLTSMLGGPSESMALLLGAGAGIVLALRARGRDRDTMAAALTVAAGTLAAAWLSSQLSPAWAHRYLALVLGPLLLLAGAGLARARWLGVAALVLVSAFWALGPGPGAKSNVREVSYEVGNRLRPGDVVLSTHPEQVPVLSHYMPEGLRYATPLGRVRDPGVMDWRDALERLLATTPDASVQPLLDSLRPGQRLLLLRPIVGEGNSWEAPWTRLVRLRSAQTARVLARDGRFVPISEVPLTYKRIRPRGVRGVLYEKQTSSP